MINFIKKLLKNLPFYNTLHFNIYTSLRNRWIKFFAEKFGIVFKKWEKENLESVKGYWEDRYREKNYYLVEKISAYSPISILEIGSNCGNKLILLAKKYPKAKIMGIEINPLAVKHGNKWLKKEQLDNVHLNIGRAEDLSNIPDKSYDVVFSWAVLIYIKPNNIRNVLQNIIRISRKAVVLLEMHGENLKKYYGVFHQPNNWKRDYKRIFNEIGIRNDRIKIEEIPNEIWMPSGGGASCIEVRI